MEYILIITVSEAPTEVEVLSRTSDSLRISWSQPTRPNGRITHYELSIFEAEPKYFIPKHCGYLPNSTATEKTSVQTEFMWEGLLPYTTYIIQVNGVNGAGSGKHGVLYAETEESGNIFFPQIKPLTSCQIIYL